MESNFLLVNNELIHVYFIYVKIQRIVYMIGVIVFIFKVAKTPILSQNFD